MLNEERASKVLSCRKDIFVWFTVRGVLSVCRIHFFYWRNLMTLFFLLFKKKKVLLPVCSGANNGGRGAWVFYFSCDWYRNVVRVTRFLFIVNLYHTALAQQHS